MASIFTRIVRGEIPCHRVAEDDRFLAFLDIAPVSDGHTLVIPKLEVDRFFELPDELLAGILPFARDVARKIKTVVPCDRVGLSGVGLEVPHAHIHLLPINGLADIGLGRPKLQRAPEQLADLAARLRAA